MRFTTLGSDRILHEGAGYRRKDYKLLDYPKGSRENPSEAKSEGGDVVYVPTTAKWIANAEGGVLKDLKYLELHKNER